MVGRYLSGMTNGVARSPWDKCIQIYTFCANYNKLQWLICRQDRDGIFILGEKMALWYGMLRVRDFTVDSAYRDLNSTGIQEIGWSWRMIQRTKIPYKVNCFSWLLMKEAVLTHENLNKRCFLLCSRCFFCEEQVETINPSLFTLQVDKSIVADFYQHEENQMGEEA